MSYYVSLNENGLPTGFYDETIYPPTVVFDSTNTPSATRNPIIPFDAFEVGHDDWIKLASGIYSVTNQQVTAYRPPASAATEDLINAERDRRLVGGFTFNGTPYQSDPGSIANITGASQLAFMAIVGGAQAGNVMWTGSGVPFVWIAGDNSMVVMDAQTVVGFAKAAAAFRSWTIYAARVLKNALAGGAVLDIYADATWSQADIASLSQAPAPAASSTS